MLNRIIRFALQNRLLVLTASILLMAIGMYTAYHTEVDVFPDLNAPTVVVMTEAGRHGYRGSGKARDIPDRNSGQRLGWRAPRALFFHHGILRGMGGVRLGYRRVSCPADCIGKTGGSGRETARIRRKPHSRPAVFHLGRTADCGTDLRLHIHARPAYPGRLDRPPAPDVGGRGGTGCRTGRRHQGVSGAAASRTHEALRA